MGLFGLFKKKSDETKVGNVEDFISLTRVYLTSNVCLKFLLKTVNWDWPKNLLRAKC